MGAKEKPMSAATVFPSVSFDESSHTYREGEIIRPSVTQCLKASGFINFDGIPFHILERKRRLGTLVHEATELWDKDEDLSSFNIPTEVFDYLEGYMNFYDDTAFKPDVIEVLHVGDISGMRYGMKPDRMGILNGEDHVIEIKCGSSESPVWGLQLAGYDAGKPAQNKRLRKRAALQLGPQFPRGYKLHPYEDPADYMMWQGCLAETIWKQNKKIFTAEPISERVSL